MSKLPWWAKALMAFGAAVAVIVIVFAIFSTVVNINNCAGIICLNFGG